MIWPLDRLILTFWLTHVSITSFRMFELCLFFDGTFQGYTWINFEMYFKVGQTNILHYQKEVWVRFRFQALMLLGWQLNWSILLNFRFTPTHIHDLFRVKIYEPFFFVFPYVFLNFKFRFIYIGLSSKCNNRQFRILVFNNRTKWRYYRQPELSRRRHAKNKSELDDNWSEYWI